MPNIQTALPHFRDSFPSPSFPPPQKTYIAPLSASSLQEYNMATNNNNNSSSNSNKRKAFEFDHQQQQHDCDYHQDSNKRTMMMMSRHRSFHTSTMGSRQRQESGCSVSSTSSSWSSSSSFSNISTTSISKSPSPSSSSFSSPRLAPEESEHVVDEFNPLWHLCDAIALISEPASLTKSTVASAPVKSSETSSKDDSPYGLKIVFVAPNWLAEHMAKSKKAAAMKKLQNLA
ncbi:hypothetical protein BGX29_011519 [Mortierella sp. GBA35]|nr:hypothetical protein BGX29_011519 [Mortierella sp. GBA35]